MRVFIALLFLFSAVASHAAEIRGRVLSVADGDTVTLLDAQKVQYRICLSGIDAPERGQPFGSRSRQNLQRLVQGREVVASCHKVDRYRRQICTLYARPPECPLCDVVDVGGVQLASGLAWWYREYADEQPPAQRMDYEAREHVARSEDPGLWSQRNPVPPREWRRR